MKKIQKLFWLLFIFACHSENLNHSKTLEIKSCDLSFLPEIRSQNVICKNLEGQKEDMLETLKNQGLNTVRLRLWNNPTDKYSGFEEVKKFSEEIKNKGLKVWISAHYSDSWADPSSQTKPNQWKKASFQQLKDSVYEFTKKIMLEIKPDFIQVGNEINNGFLFPEGSFSYPNQLSELLAQGIRAVREQNSHTKIVLHYAGYQNATYFFSNFKNLDYDLIGLSFYPIWHGKNLEILASQLDFIGNMFNKKIIIAETSYPFSFGWNDSVNNIIGDSGQIIADYPASPDGQKKYLEKIKEILEKSAQGIGFCYWGGEWIAFKGSKSGSSYENQALWNFENQALPAIQVFK